MTAVRDDILGMIYGADGAPFSDFSEPDGLGLTVSFNGAPFIGVPDGGGAEPVAAPEVQQWFYFLAGNR